MPYEPYTGYEYTRHIGCDHPVREHKYDGCHHPECLCDVARYELARRGSFAWWTWDLLTRIVGTGVILYYVGDWLVEALT